MLATLALSAVLLALPSSPLAAQEPAAPPPASPLVASTAVELPHVEGRIDHLAIDLGRGRLFVAALENDSVEVVDLAAGKHLKSLRGLEGLSEPQGILYLADCDRIVVANGGSGLCLVLDGETFEPLAKVDVGSDSDNLRYDAKHKRVCVAYGQGGLATIDAQSWKVLDRIKLTDHPEGFQVDAEGLRAWVNIPGTHRITLLDLSAHRMAGSWLLEGAEQNYPVSMVADASRLLLGCRSPAKLYVCSLAGDRVQLLDLSGDVDDIFYDAARKRAYAICGEGFVDVFERDDSGNFRREDRTATAPGARTGLYVAERNELFVAVPHRGEQRAEIRAFRVAD
jgi:hypothetical protein